MSIKQLVDRIVADGVLTEKEHQEFLNKVREDNRIDPEESEQIARLMKMIENGELNVR
jgi:polyhydroxyalkanoate synthesis regulator phasin